jgi:hypothetical protein
VKKDEALKLANSWAMEYHECTIKDFASIESVFTIAAQKLAK